MKIVYIAHAISGDIENNLADIRRIVKKINLEMPDVVPFVPYYVDIVSLDDNVPEQRKRGIKNDTEYFFRDIMDEVWLTGKNISKGMLNEIETSNALGIPVIDFTNKL